MRLRLDPRARTLIRRLPQTSVYSVLELVLLTLLAVQGARLMWTLVTPVGPLGDWRPQIGVMAGDPAQAARLRSFDPFFRLSTGTGEVVLTSLELTLYGVRVDEATGRGSAILSGPDDVQTSYAVGDEILPGVILTSVSYDNVVISRGGAEESLFLDQSTAAPNAEAVVDAAGGAPAIDPRVAAQQPMVSLDAIRRDVQLAPRVENGQVSGLTVGGGGSPTLAQAGLQPGDVIVEAGGQPVASASDVEAILGSVAPGGSLPVVVERGGERVSIAIPVGR